MSLFTAGEFCKSARLKTLLGPIAVSTTASLDPTTFTSSTELITKFMTAFCPTANCTPSLEASRSPEALT